MLGAVPADGSTAECENDYVKVQVLLVNEHRIEKMRITKKPKPVEEEQKEETADEDKDKKFRLFKKEKPAEDDSSTDEKE